MKVERFGRAAAILSVASVALVACGGNGDNGGGDAADSDVSGNLTGSGASSFQVAMEEWQFQFGDQTDASVDYNAVGSGQGRSEFLSGAVDFAGSDAVMDDDEYEQSTERCGADGAFHLPAAILPIGVAVNLEGVDTVNLDADTLADIFSGEITSWDDPAIAEHNEDADLPDTPITVIHRSDDSGTTENFTEYLEQASTTWGYEADGEWPGEISAESADGTSGVVDAVSGQDGAITYADAGQIPDELALVSVEVGGEYSEVSPEAASQAVEASDRLEGQAENNLAFELSRDTDEAGAYPIVQVAYTIWCNEYESQEEADLAAAFASYIVSEGAQQIGADEAGAAPLPEELRSEAEDAIGQISAGE